MLQSVIYPPMMYPPGYNYHYNSQFCQSLPYFDPSFMVEPSQTSIPSNLPWMVPVSPVPVPPSAIVQETAPVYSRPPVKIRMKANPAVTVATLYSHKIFVGSLGKNTSPHDLAKLFAKFGTVIEAKVVVDNDGNSKGYGFVSFPSAEPVEKVLSSSTIYMDGKRIVVASAIRKQHID